MFQNKLLVSAVLGLGVLSISTIAHADTTSGNSGIYVGAQGGFAETDYGSQLKNFIDQFPSHDNDEGGAAGRFFVGWQFNQFLSVEGGYTILPDNEYKGSMPLGTSLNATEKTSAWDIQGKATLPFSQFTNSPNPFSVYVKGGATYVDSEVDLDSNIGPNVGVIPGLATPATVNQNIEDKSWEPIAGAGLEFQATNNFYVFIDYSHIFGSDTSLNNLGSNDVNAPSSDMGTIGVRYLFSMA